MMEQKIFLPYAGSNVYFTVEELVKHFNTKELDFIIIGASLVKLENHKKQKSLDVWFRNHNKVLGKKKNTCQAVNSVLERLVAFEQFSVEKRMCSSSGRMCKALIFAR